MLSAIFGLAVSYLLVFGLDRLVDTPAWLRVAILTAGMVGMVIIFPLKYHNWVWRHRRLDQVARLLRRKYPRFGDHVLAVVELACADADRLSSPALVEAAMRQVDEELEHRDLEDAVPDPRHYHWAWAAAVPVVVAVALMICVPAASLNALARWLLPWSDVDRYTFAQLEGEPSLRVTPYAEPFGVGVQLKKDSPWKPESGTARYEKQPRLAAQLQGAAYQFQIPPQTEDGHVFIRVGDARRAIPVEPKMRPELKELLAKIQHPEYLQRPEPETEDVRGGSVRLVSGTGSSVLFEATATRDLAHATLNDRPQCVDGPRIITETIAAEASGQHRLAWRDHLGLAVREPQVLRVEIRDDGAPKVGCNKLKSNQVILATDALVFEIWARDDFGVKQVGLEWEGVADPQRNPEPDKGEKTVAAGGPRSDKMQVPATFSAEREKVPPQTLRLRAFAEDYLPGRERAYSSYFVVHVLTPEKHLQWLTEQMEHWTDSAREVYDRELQLHETNKELRDLPPEALDDPAQRRKIQKQAVEERANTARLSNLTDLGKELIREATKNEEFDAEQLDAWAEMLKQLEEIADKKMPSIAELLAKAADASGKPPESKPQEGQPDEGESEEETGPKPSETSNQPPPPEGLEGPMDKDFNKFEKSQPPEPPPLGLPVNIIQGSGREDEGDAAPADVGELMDKAVEEQQEMLDAFAKLTDEMNKLLASLEDSTFVKRLKAASQRQLDLARELNEHTLEAFGVEKDLAEEEPRSRATAVGQREEEEAEIVFTIIQELEAFLERRPLEKYTRVLDEMKEMRTSGKIRRISEALTKNLLGQSIHEAEFWADTLDRWAEQLVDPLEPLEEEEVAEAEQMPSLTPDIVLQVLRILDGEIKLRAETRELEKAKEAIGTQEYRERSTELSKTQGGLDMQTREVIRTIHQLPRGEAFEEQIMQLTAAADVMAETTGILATPDTGPAAIAAETEVIEILLITHRIPKVPAPAVSGAPTSVPALALIGRSDDGGEASINPRDPGQATGKAGRELPEEFRQGLDIYFGVLEEAGD